MNPSTINGSLCISLFSGAGGLDIGFERAGFSTVSMCELEPQFAETLRQNQGWPHSDGHRYFADATILQNDIREVHAKQLTHGESIDCADVANAEWGPGANRKTFAASIRRGPPLQIAPKEKRRRNECEQNLTAHLS